MKNQEWLIAGPTWEDVSPMDERPIFRVMRRVSCRSSSEEPMLKSALDYQVSHLEAHRITLEHNGRLPEAPSRPYHNPGNGPRAIASVGHSDGAYSILVDSVEPKSRRKRERKEMWWRAIRDRIQRERD